jgi:hypothetical protein
VVVVVVVDAMAEDLFAAEKAELPDEWHETFDALTAQGYAPRSIKATIEYVRTQKTQEECAEEFGSSHSTIQGLQSAVVALGPVDNATQSIGGRGSMKTADYCERIADRLGWEEGEDYTVADYNSSSIALNKSAWRSLHRAVVANTEESDD